MNMRDQLSAYVDGELTPEELAAVEAVLAQDPELRAELNAFKRLSNELRVDEADRAVADVIRARLRRSPRSRWRAWWPALVPVVTGVVVVLLLWPTPAPTLTSADLFGQYSEAVLSLGEPSEELNQ